MGAHASRMGLDFGSVNGTLQDACSCTQNLDQAMCCVPGASEDVRVAPNGPLAAAIRGGPAESHQGPVAKRDDYSGVWKQSYLMLRRGLQGRELVCYVDQHACQAQSPPSGVLSLQGCELKVKAQKSETGYWEFSIEDRSTGKVWECGCPERGDRSTWVAILQSATGAPSLSQGYGPSPLKASGPCACPCNVIPKPSAVFCESAPTVATWPCFLAGCPRILS
jgi:hypothetical protein